MMEERKAYEKLALLLDNPYQHYQNGYKQWRKDVDKAIWEWAKAVSRMVVP